MSYERLDAYQLTAKFSDFLQSLLPRIRAKSATLATQMQRASESAELTACEASKGQTAAMTANYFRMSEGSCSELKGALKRAERLGAITKEERIEGQRMMSEAGFYFLRLVRYWEGKAEE